MQDESALKQQQQYPQGIEAAGCVDDEKPSRAPRYIKACIFLLILGVVAALVVLPQVFGTFPRPQHSPETSNNDEHQKDTPDQPIHPPHPEPHYGPNLTVIPNPKLSQSFYGIDYTPHGTQYEDGCGASLEEVVEDLKVLSQLTTRVRLYGMDCNQAELVLEGIRLLQINMGVMMTVWVDGNHTTYERQHNTFWKVIKKYGADHIIGVSVGNEVLFRRQMEVSTLIGLIKDFKARMVKAGYPHIPVATTEIRELKQLIPIEDMVLDNVHPFFAGTLVEDAANWTWQYFYDVDQYPTMQLAKDLANGQTQAKPAIISEIGWPSEPKDEFVQAAVPSLKNLNILLDTFVCEANRRQVPYYWFEFRDQPWKTPRFNESREAYWGLFDKDRKLKPAQMPRCLADPWQRGNYSTQQPVPLGILDKSK